MTKKDYELIASVLDGLYMGHDDWQRSLPQVAYAFADALKRTNPKFDRKRFLEACGVEQEPKCSKYPDDFVLPDENGNCSLCGSTINRYGECLGNRQSND